MFRPLKQRARGTSQPTLTSPWLEWTEALNGEMNSNIKTMLQFITGLLVPNDVGHDVEKAFKKIKLYMHFIAHPPDIPYHGSLGSFLYTDLPSLLIDDQKTLELI